MSIRTDLALETHQHFTEKAESLSGVKVFDKSVKDIEITQVTIETEEAAEKIKATGVKSADAIHTACALIAECDYMLSTDDRLLKFKPERMKLVSPVEFI